MKKILCTILTITMAMQLFSGISAFAADNISVELDGNIITFDVEPQIINDRVMVPLRKIFEEIGALVKWDDASQTVTARKSSKTVSLSIDSRELVIDKGNIDEEGNPILETVNLDVPAQIVSGRTLVPARAISEGFGMNVVWDENNQKVVITSDDDEDNSWKENIGTINLSDLTYDGEGIEIVDNQIKITAGGDFTLTGTLTDGNVTISTKEKVKLRLSGASITSSSTPCIFVENADKAYITITEDTENFLVAENSEDGAIYSKDNLEMKGKGTLFVTSSAGHGIKASDNLTIENGNINIDASRDGIHVNDTFKMTGGNINITAVGDGIDSESIVNISDGTINIETNGTPIETAAATEKATRDTHRGGMWEADEADVEFESSTKGINAEWMMVISGGEININSASHAIHCQDEIQIDGGKITVNSKYDKGISAHGNLTINGADTVIDVIKSTEGIESKNVMTINDGTISVVSTDDALNATGGNSGNMGMPGGNMGGNGNDDNRIKPENNTVNPPEQIMNGTQTNIRPGHGGNKQFGESPNNGEFAPPNSNQERDDFASPNGNRPQANNSEAIPSGNMGGMGRNMKECLIINGGDIELYAEDDCLDSNGSLAINGGTVKAIKPDGSIYGAFAIVDPDGQTTISENAMLIFAAGNGNEKSLGLKQNVIIVNCENNHEAGDEITVLDSNGNVVFEYAPNGSYKTVLIASNTIKTGEKYSITVGSESFETEITQQSTTIGTQNAEKTGFGRAERMQ